MLLGVWSFSIIWLLGIIVLRGDLFTALILFFFATIFSIAAAALPEKMEPLSELLTELQNIKTKMDALSKEVEQIKKEIEE